MTDVLIRIGKDTRNVYRRKKRPGEDTARWGPFANQGERSQEKSTLPAP